MLNNTIKENHQENNSTTFTYSLPNQGICTKTQAQNPKTLQHV